MVPPLPVAFVGGGSGPWRIERIEPVSGEPLDDASHLEVLEGASAQAVADGARLGAARRDEQRALRDPRRLDPDQQVGEYPPRHAAAFEDLVRRLRATEEWAYVEREVDLRLAWEGAPAAQG